MDWIVPVALAANTALLLGGMVVGGRLLFPTARRLPDYLERLLKERQNASKLTVQLETLTSELAATREELARVSERQQFVEALLEDRLPPALPPA